MTEQTTTRNDDNAVTGHEVEDMLVKSVPVWLNESHTRFAWGPYRPIEEDPDFT